MGLSWKVWRGVERQVYFQLELHSHLFVISDFGLGFEKNPKLVYWWWLCYLCWPLIGHHLQHVRRDVWLDSIWTFAWPTAFHLLYRNTPSLLFSPKTILRLFSCVYVERLFSPFPAMCVSIQSPLERNPFIVIRWGCSTAWRNAHWYVMWTAW